MYNIIYHTTLLKGDKATRRILVFILITIIITPGQIAHSMAETAKSVCLINTVTGEIIFEKNANEKKSMASTTKIMTLLVALENSAMDEIVTVSREATLEEGSSAYLKPGAKITMKDLLYGLMLNSGNDAAVAVAEHISGNCDKFALLMTETAHNIGANDTQFKNTNGLEMDGHYTTARDLALITQYALMNESFREIVSTSIYTSTMFLSDGTTEHVEYINHNRLLRELEGCIGVKTGYTKAAGRCLVSAVSNGGAEYIAVTLDDSNDWKTHKELYEYAYNSQHIKTLVRKGDCIKHISSGQSECMLVTAEDYDICVNEGRTHDFEVVVNLPDNINFPLNSGEKVGFLEVKLNNRCLRKIDIIANGDYSPHEETKVKDCFMFTLLTLLRNLL